MIKGYELYELIAKGNTLQNTKIIDARNKVWKFDGAEFVKEIGDSDIYSDLEFATMDFEIIEDEEEIDIQKLFEDIEMCLKRISDFLPGEGYSSVRNYIERYENDLKAVKQLDKNIKELR